MPRNAEASNASISITNKEFLEAIAGDDWRRVPISWGENSWWVRPAGKNISKPTVDTSNYFTVSLFKLAGDGKFARKKELFERQCVFVIDDVGTKLLEAEVRAVMPPATYELETSPGNWQYGYKLTNGTDARALDALVCAIVDDPEINPSLKDPGMKGVTRVARLPVGSNNKDKWKDAEGKGWPHRMTVWEPSRAYSVEDLAFWLGVDLGEESLARFKDVAGARRATASELEADPILKIFDMKEMLLDATPNDNGFVSVICPWAAEHSDSRNEAGYRPGSGGFQCHHGHCESRNMNDLRAWVAENVTPAEQAQALAETFGEIDDSLVRAELHRAKLRHDPAYFELFGDTDDDPLRPASMQPSSRKMRIEWFSEASALALSEPSNPLIDDMLDEGALSVIYGESNSGKTFVTLDMAMAVGAGLPWNGKATKRGLVIYVAAEGGKRIQRRLAALRRRYHDAQGDDAAEPLLALVRFPIDLRTNDANLKELLALVRQAEADTGEKCAWIIVDTLSRALAGGDENSPVDMGRIVVAADRIRDATGAHFTYVHHSGKDAARGARGHSLLRAATDTEIETTPGALRVTKQRDMDGGQQYGFELTDVYIGADANGRPIHSATVTWTGKPVAAAGAAPKASRAARVYLDALGTVLQATGVVARPFGAAGPELFAGDRERVRVEFYARWAADGDTEKKRVAAKQKAFRRAEEELSDAGGIGMRESGKATLVWLDTGPDTGQDAGHGQP